MVRLDLWSFYYSDLTAAITATLYGVELTILFLLSVSLYQRRFAFDLLTDGQNIKLLWSFLCKIVCPSGWTSFDWLDLFLFFFLTYDCVPANAKNSKCGQWWLWYRVFTYDSSPVSPVKSWYSEFFLVGFYFLQSILLENFLNKQMGKCFHFKTKRNFSIVRRFAAAARINPT